ncbi:HlyD family secretion protein (plasmid) [Pacificitalea manganoxidans]|uniref:HlyD family secretion protein n=1 Tax=Pacificitalea manganoxidans TaxID=1411902 RepID=A0A291M3M0_9RHOB|nr:HlyD family secretion protein [Pacificitalea manganoxidans]ATI43532.1 HlyD family secretion protein [Pacificitalea manganoxidans]MDR6309872.1 multidrug resistance efflux pump [Pacificitalea manganoxidans]OWU67915.1 hypothetical protein ATO2_13265 [Roseovarius sp. 22II1-1F6A]
MRFIRLGLGLALFVFALWVIIGEQLSSASANAFVNARLTTVRAPVAGDVDLPAVVLGSRVDEGERLGAISDPLADNIRRNDLIMEQSLARAEVARLERAITANADVMDGLRARAETFRERRVAELEIRLDHAQSRLALLRDMDLAPDAVVPDTGDAQADPALTDLQLNRVLDDRSDALPAEPVTYALALDHAEERVKLVENALATARNGVFLGDGYNDAPNAGQRLAELQSVAADLETDLAAAESRLHAYTVRVEQERIRVNRLSGTAVSSPVMGVVWELRAAPGENVQRGDPLITLVDCSSAMVSLSVTESTYNRLSIGAPASYRPSGSDEVFQGTVSRLAGAGAETVYRNLAIAPSAKHLERYDVTLLIPTLRDDPELGCAIGRTGRAFFEARPLDWLRGLWR